VPPVKERPPLSREERGGGARHARGRGGRGPLRARAAPQATRRGGASLRHGTVAGSY